MTGERIQKVVDAVEGETILDLGAAQHDASKEQNGDWLHKHLCDECRRVVGVDFLPDAVAELNKRGYEFVQADVTDMQIDIEADTVVAGELIEHIDNPGLLLERVQEHLKPGGALVLTTPNPWGFPILRRILTKSLQINQEHVAWYGPTVLEQLLARYEFEVEWCETTRRNQGGIFRLIQAFDRDLLSGTTWVLKARFNPDK